MPVTPLTFRQTTGMHQRFLEKKRPGIEFQQANINRIANVPNPEKQANANALLSFITLLGPMGLGRHHLSPMPMTERTSRQGITYNRAPGDVPTGAGKNVGGLLPVSRVSNEQHPAMNNIPFHYAGVRALRKAKKSRTGGVATGGQPRLSGLLQEQLHYHHQNHCRFRLGLYFFGRRRVRAKPRQGDGRKRECVALPGSSPE